MLTYYLSKSSRKNKKFMIKSEGSPTIHFGDSRYEDYTMHGDSDRKKRYILRHQNVRFANGKNEDWANPQTAGFWAYHLLWHKPTISEAIKNMSRQFGIKVIY